MMTGKINPVDVSDLLPPPPPYKLVQATQCSSLEVEEAYFFCWSSSAEKLTERHLRTLTSFTIVLPGRRFCQLPTVLSHLLPRF